MKLEKSLVIVQSVSGQNGRANDTREPAGDGLWKKQSVSDPKIDRGSWIWNRFQRSESKTLDWNGLSFISCFQREGCGLHRKPGNRTSHGLVSPNCRKNILMWNCLDGHDLLFSCQLSLMFSPQVNGTWERPRHWWALCAACRECPGRKSWQPVRYWPADTGRYRWRSGHNTLCFLGASRVVIV